MIVSGAVSKPMSDFAGRRLGWVPVSSRFCCCLPGRRSPRPRREQPSTPEQDPFYKYEGKTQLSQIAPGTVLKTRTVLFTLAGITLPITAVQLLYRSTSSCGKPTVNVTSVLLPPVKLGTPTVVSYQSFYDSLNTEDDPSYAISRRTVAREAKSPRPSRR